MSLLKPASVLVVAAFLSSCGGSSGLSSSGQGAEVEANPVSAQSSEALSPILTELTYSTALLNNANEFRVEVSEADVSMLVNLQLRGNDGGVLIKEIIDPAGVTIYQAELSGNNFNVESDFFNTPLAGEDVVTAFLPPTPKMTLSSGTYRFILQKEGSVEFSSAKVFMKSHPAGGDTDLANLEMDLNIMIMDPSPDYRSESFQNTLKTSYRDNINSMLSAHGIRLDKVKVYLADDAQTQRYKIIDDEDFETFNAACRTLHQAADNPLALNALFIEDFAGGNAGSSPFAGIILDKTADDSCFAVARKAYEVSSGNSADTEEEIAQQAANILHEGMHFMSLEHTTEMDGQTFDTIQDTAECDAQTYDGRDNPNPDFGEDGQGEKDGVVSDHECGTEGGANNVLFWAGHPDFLPFEVSDDQAWVLKRHPLLRLED